MYKVSVPLCINTLNEQSLPMYVDELKKGEIERVFLLDSSSFAKKDSYIHKNPDKVRNLIAFFKQSGFEVGVWESGFGHGGMLSHEKESEYVDKFISIVGADGRVAGCAFCPLDEKLQNLFYNSIKKLAEMQPDIIMFDDDFRLNARRLYMGCCCEKHLEMFYKRVGKRIPRENMEEFLFTGGENFYRSEWLKCCGESLVEFAKLLRKGVDEVNPSIRMGTSLCFDMWDFSGTDGIEISKAFAGNTKPFLRTIGAPYHGKNVQNAVEQTRMQAEWCKNKGIEIFTEGDVYPRPRYNVPSKILEVFDLALLATNCTDGILKYMFDYSQNVSYEMGYNKRHIRNRNLRKKIKDVFNEKKNIGVRVFEYMHKTEKYDLPKDYFVGISHIAQKSFFSRAIKLLGDNGIPTMYESGGNYPVIAFGENAKYISIEELKNGAIIDINAARILMDRGVDTGLIEYEEKSYTVEKYGDNLEEISGLSEIATYRIKCSSSATVKSSFMPDDVPASYTYVNSDGIRFFVFAIDSCRSSIENNNYFVNYYRQNQLIEAIEWLGKIKLPAVCIKNPFSYIQVAKSIAGEKKAVALYNMHIDDIIDGEIVLDKEYKSVTFINCTGEINGNIVKITSVIPAYECVIIELE